MPKDYVMQGMIADSGGEWRLYKRHHTLAMITHWIFHPFRHLENGDAAMHHAMEGEAGAHSPSDAMVRRLIFLKVQTSDGQSRPGDLFGVNAHRSPLFVADVNVHELELEEVRDLPGDTGWGRVPTPAFSRKRSFRMCCLLERKAAS